MGKREGRSVGELAWGNRAEATSTMTLDVRETRLHPACPLRCTECMFWKLRPSLVVFVALCWETDHCTHPLFHMSESIFAQV